MSKYETYLEELENGDDVSNEALEAAADSLAFVTALYNVFRDNGYDLPAEPDMASLENVLDGMMSELSAACIFLSEDSFKQVPNMLRAIGQAFATTSGGEEVPTLIVHGYNRLADRIEATRFQQQQSKGLVTAQNAK
jgi:hypothetical protein